MPSGADERSRALGGLVCLGAIVTAALFLYGLAVGSYWAIALPVAAGLLFVLGLVFWIGWTILTVQAHAEGEPLVPVETQANLTQGGGPGAATQPDPGTAEASLQEARD